MTLYPVFTPFRYQHAWFLLFVGFVNLTLPTAKGSHPLITVEVGDLPIILSAPHGGLDEIPGVRPRQGNGDKTFVAVPDVSTNKLTAGIADSIETKIGKRPYVVIAKFHRKYLDANRPRARAYESVVAEQVYDAYHRALADARQDVIDRWGHGILLDIHGQKADPDVVFRGTNNGRTTTHLVSRFGWPSLTDSPSLFGQLAKSGLRVFPAVGSSDREHSRFNGGYIAAKYGSRDAGTVDAIQLEVGRNLRSLSNRPKTTEQIASAIVAFGKSHLHGHDPSENQPMVTPLTNSKLNAKKPQPLGSQPNSPQEVIFQADFDAGDQRGWFVTNRVLSEASVATSAAMLENPPELWFTAQDSSSLKSLVTHFPEVSLDQAGDTVTLQFDACHQHEGFLNRGFRFGLFHSKQTLMKSDGENDNHPISLDDNGYFAIVDLGTSTTLESAAIRETTNSVDPRLWNGSSIASDQNGNASDPLIFTRNKRTTYALTLTRNPQGSIDLKLRNHVSGNGMALTGTSKLTPMTTFDTLYFGTDGTTSNLAIDHVTVVTGKLASGVKSGDSNETAVRVGVYIDQGAGPSKKDLLYVLGKCDNVTIERLSAEDIRVGRLAEVDVLILPGGSGGGQGRHLGEEGRDAIRGFVRQGGGFVGICAGAYVASADYSWSLNLLDAKVVDREHWNRGTGAVDIVLTASGRELMNMNSNRVSIHYAQGPLLAPAGRPDIDDYEAIAMFETEIAKNGASPGVMKGTTAIARGQYGQGRVVCFSPHPEMTNGLESMVQVAIDHVKRRRPPKSTTPTTETSPR